MSTRSCLSYVTSCDEPCLPPDIQLQSYYRGDLSPGKVSESKSGLGKVGDNVLLHVVSYHEYCY